MDNIEVKLDQEDRKMLKDLIEYQVKLEKAINESKTRTPQEAIKSSGFLQSIVNNAAQSYARNVGVSGVYGAGGAESFSGYKPKGFGGDAPSSPGFLDGILKVAGGIALVDAIKSLTKQSKVLSTVQDTVGKALGLLVDLVLLPFLPLLVFGLLYLYTAIMWVGKIWNDWIAKSGIGEAAAKVLNPPADSTALSRTLDFLALINELAKAWLDGMTRLIIGTAVFFGELFTNILKFGIELIANIGQALGEGWLKFQEWIVQKVRDLIVVISEAWTKVATGLDANLITPIKNAINVLRDGFIGMINWVIDRINSVLPPGFKISNIEKPQDYSDPGTMKKPFSTTNVQVTNNFNGFTASELPGMLDNAIRQVGDRYMPGSA